ncbi:MAG: diphosphate--fructose-6-phosphate 1-phosphotransferase [Bacteroidetes bacterium GWF2_49_14]|nr:MAG: diphosphate--fructose-6-phosphate 1-phosphotransferase [Bacteroidetes bacterium GWF2_49_14]HBB93186.1 ATP-dependent 6-phosphofructokinase [Bacteroidales bacterium]
MKPEDFDVKELGRATAMTPLNESIRCRPSFGFVTDNDRVLYDTSLASYDKYCKLGEPPVSFEKAGPREFLFFQPSKTKVGIITCGGLCPGLNNVIRSLVMELHYRYGVKNIIGFQYGYEGLIPDYDHAIVDLTKESVNHILHIGGTVLGSSRGEQDVSRMVDTLEMLNINILFTIGGDGTLRGAHALHEEITKRGLKIAVGGVPKTIDNDINLIDKSFGFETAFTIAREVIRNAHNEASGAYNGIALVKLMGRESGFIAAHAALSIQEVNFVLVPEMRFRLDGPDGFIDVLKKRLEHRHHALIVVAEGAGQEFFSGEKQEKDASGNIKNKDIGIYLKEKITEAFKPAGFPHTIRYIDPSYYIRSAAANANDSKFCSLLAQNAVHAAMSGKTDFVVGHWNNEFTLIPIPVTVSERKKIDINGELWWNVLEATGQPGMI